MSPIPQTNDDVVVALEELALTVEANADDGRLLARRVRSLRDARARGRSWTEAISAEKEPGALELLGRMLKRLAESSGTLRRALVTSLRSEGVTVPAIADAFGVSHQRVSTVLRQDEAARAKLAIDAS